MTVSEIKREVMFQTNNDVDDLGDFSPYLMDYINDGYDRLMYQYKQEHAEFLQTDEDIPDLPEWTHRALADWATWLVYRNGNPNTQSRGVPFQSAFYDILGKISDQGGIKGVVKNFYNIPT